MIRISSFIFLGLLSLQFESGPIFFCKEKQKYSDRTITREWKLSLNSDAKFKYTIINTTQLKLDKNQINRDSVFYSGLWRYDGDTLFLYSDACPKNEIKYLKRNKYLYSLGSCIDSFSNKRIKRLGVLK